jgi:colicin import membrane protein
MRHALNIGKEPKFYLIVVTSAVIHLLLITFIVVPLKTRDREYKNYFVNLVGPVETPVIKKSSEGRANVPASLTEKAETNKLIKPLPKADMSLETDKTISKEIERIRALSALSKQKKKKEEAKVQDIEVIRQKILGSASKEQGMPSVLQSNESDPYIDLIISKITSEWIYPASDSSGLEVIITIKIDSNGKVISQEIEKSSGNILFDRSAVKAILKASPLPPPPVDMEIGVRFHPW